MYVWLGICVVISTGEERERERKREMQEPQRAHESTERGGYPGREREPL